MALTSFFPDFAVHIFAVFNGEFNEVEYENGIEIYEDLNNDSFLAFSDDD